MPERVPLYVLCSQFILRIMSLVKTCSRFLCVALVWLVLLPNFTLRTWRFYFWSGENIGFTFNNDNKNEEENNDELTLKGFFYDCLEGQIITAFVVIVFVAAYLFREWMMQNLPDEPLEEQENQLDQQHIALDTLDNAFQVLDQQNEDDHIRNQLQYLMNDLENERERKHLYQSERPNPSSFSITPRLDKDQMDEDLLFGGLDGTGLSNDKREYYRHDDKEEDLILQNDTRKNRRKSKLPDSDIFNEQEDQPPSPSPLEPPINPPRREQPVIIDNVVNNPANEEENDINNNNNDDDDEPFDVADDINGILEAIGMRGNPWMLLQNSVLMALIISLCLGISIWVPYVLGRLAIMLRPAGLVETLVDTMRLMSDPMVDFILDQGIPLVWSVIEEPIKFMLPESVKTCLCVAQKKLIQCFGNTTLPSNILTLEINSSNNSASNTSVSISPSFLTEFSSLFFSFDWNSFEQKVKVKSILALTRWHQVSSGRTTLDRSICILVGYLVLICLGSFYLSLMKIRRCSPDSFFQDLIRQQGIFLKVLFFFIIEMLIFPTACGFLLDMTTLPLFSMASLESRFDFQLKNPFSSLFLHWFFGTGVLFYFANFITVCREIIRPGVLWYIRDPNDPQFHPIQEMVDKPFTTLLRKIGYSAFAYSFILIFGVGTVTYGLALTDIVFPLRLSFSNPLFSNVSIDFLAVQFLLPPLIMLIKPREYSKKALDWWWHFVCRQLRLTSYMFNMRMADEEGHHMRRTLKAWLTFEKASNLDNCLNIQNHNNNSTIFQPDGMLVRAPKYDSVVVDSGRRMLVPVDPVHFQPIDQEERGRKHPAAGDTDDEDQSTIIVYIPTFFYQRVTIFLVLLWFSISSFACSVTVIPLLLGRFLFSYYFAPNAKVSDLYSFSLGFYIIVAFVFALHKSFKFKYYDSYMDHIITAIKKVTKFLYLASTLGLIMPLIFGIAVDFFVLMPIRISEHKNGLVIDVSRDWSFGVAYISIIYNIIHLFPTPNRLQRHIDEITSNGILQADCWAITSTIAAPVILGSLVAIAIPGIISWGVLQFLDPTSFSSSDYSVQISVIRYIYPATFCAFIVLLVAFIIKKLLGMWIQTIRDDTYLIGKRLHNINDSQTVVS
ncbi:hypothetical protein K501DRAFT_252110 [Backusella circina FSU 941]|nr:hypothetical protein K501DRAFT_252110 [Backusella circina FSU 941]